MPSHILRVDLSSETTAFEALAVDLGRPLLDPGQGNYRALRTWFKDQVAEPEWSADGRSVKFYIQQNGGRLLDVMTDPVATSDLDGKLAAQWKLLETAHQTASPASSSEKALHDSVGRILKGFRESAGRGRIPFVFHKYRDAGRQWRLVWCWGYQRRSSDPASPRICGTDSCDRLLFAQEMGQQPRCPGCSSQTSSDPPRRSLGVSRRALLAAGLLLFLGVGLFFGLPYLKNRPGSTPATNGTTTVVPEPLTVLVLEVGESKPLGEIKIFPGGEKIGNSDDVLVTDSAIVHYDDVDRTLSGVEPGTTSLIVTRGSNQPVTLPIKVVWGDPKTGTLRIEPAGGPLAVSEERPLAVFLVTPQGQRLNRTGAATLAIADPTADPTAEIVGHSIRGLRAGQAIVTVSLPGADAPARVEFIVKDEPILSLKVEPDPVHLEVHSWRAIQITGMTGRGAIQLFQGPGLKIAISKEDEQVVKINSAHVVTGMAEGEARLTVSWRDQIKQEVAVKVTDDPIRSIYLMPAHAEVGRGGETNFQVFGRRKGRHQALGLNDGVNLEVGDKAIAATSGGLHVRGLTLGTTEVTAQYGSLKATANLTVTKEPPVRPPDPLPAPGLYFRPESLKLAVGLPIRTVTVVHVLPDGTEVNVSAEVKLHSDGSGIVEVKPGQAPLMIRPLKAGSVQIRADLGTVKTVRPLQIDVFDLDPRLAELRVVPDPLRLKQGQRTSFSRSMIYPARGFDPVPVTCHLSSTGTEFVRIEDKTDIVGVKPGQAKVTFTVQDPGGKYDKVETTATVIVFDELFERIVLHPPNAKDGNLTVEVEVFALTEKQIEYRLYQENKPEEPVKWVAAQRTDDGFFLAKLVSPNVRIEKNQKVYKLVIEARNVEPNAPIRSSFRLVVTPPDVTVK